MFETRLVQIFVSGASSACAAQRNNAGTMSEQTIIMDYLEFDYFHFDEDEQSLRRESLTLLVVGHQNESSACYFITKGGTHSGWHGSWIAERHDDTGLLIRIKLYFFVERYMGVADSPGYGIPWA